MPLIPDTEKEAFCPYCWEGTIEYDIHSKRIYCNICKYTCKCKGLEIPLD